MISRAVMSSAISRGIPAPLAAGHGRDVEPFVRFDKIDIDAIGAARIDHAEIVTGIRIAARGVAEPALDQETCTLQAVAHAA
jgi:hypothetical protein